jgi:uncharacterized repeat protein (TIGR01451 family)
MARSGRAFRFVAATLLAAGLMIVLAPLGASAASIADVGVVITAHPDPVVTKSKLTYKISVTNVSNPAATAIAVNVHDQLSLSQSYVSSHTSLGTCAFNAGNFDCALGDVGPGVTVIVKLVVKELGTLQDSTTVSVTTSSSDPVPANNTARALTMIKKRPPPSRSPKPHKSPKPSPSGKPPTTASGDTFAPGSGGSSSTALPILGAILAAAGFIALAGFFAWREHQTP